ncbi:unnamed protein product [Soboliphyme baturini]|uniref:Ion_trans domain-containing protein n=1 Tax=Soboliphyme baturini TaxID=241478 RepID=A0A183IA63_9BILA|nr:unnamed protein product [Soboliphyme baturini]
MFRFVVGCGHRTFRYLLRTAEILKRFFLLESSTMATAVLLALLILCCLTVEALTVWHYSTGTGFANSLHNALLAGTTVGYNWVNLAGDSKYLLTLYPMVTVPLFTCANDFYEREKKNFLRLVSRKLSTTCLNAEDPREGLLFDEVVQQVERSCRKEVTCGWLIRLSVEDKASLFPLWLDMMKRCQQLASLDWSDVPQVTSYVSNV